eukprot:TRINITY_DN5159_c0_g1_i2.p1 TRINITY_DN5159_c0_g1~~TRINITY_DN5159_c0_g1_i2.p1  ORF type:complete len:914 (+),score=194.41 TRINITY_DN5159_c0_g1_i2:79-2820(+)
MDSQPPSIPSHVASVVDVESNVAHANDKASQSATTSPQQSAEQKRLKKLELIYGADASDIKQAMNTPRDKGIGIAASMFEPGSERLQALAAATFTMSRETANDSQITYKSAEKVSKLTGRSRNGLLTDMEELKLLLKIGKEADKIAEGYILELLSRFDYILNCKWILNYFRLFVEKEQNSENLAFYLDVDKYQGLDSQQELQKLHATICQKYIEEGSPFEINISGELRNEILLQRQEISRDSFNEPQDRVRRLLETNSYKRFLQDPLGQEVVNKMKDIRNSGILSLQVLQGRDLLGLKKNGFSDSYCSLKLDSQSFRTRVMKDCLFPEWNETFQFNIASNAEEIQLEVFHEVDKISLGFARIPLGLCKDEQKHDVTLPLVPKSSEFTSRGEIRICYQFLHTEPDFYGRVFSLSELDKIDFPPFLRPSPEVLQTLKSSGTSRFKHFSQDRMLSISAPAGRLMRSFSASQQSPQVCSPASLERRSRLLSGFGGGSRKGSGSKSLAMRVSSLTGEQIAGGGEYDDEVTDFALLSEWQSNTPLALGITIAEFEAEKEDYTCITYPESSNQFGADIGFVRAIMPESTEDDVDVWMPLVIKTRKTALLSKIISSMFPEHSRSTPFMYAIALAKTQKSKIGRSHKRRIIIAFMNGPYYQFTRPLLVAAFSRYFQTSDTSVLKELHQILNAASFEPRTVELWNTYFHVKRPSLGSGEIEGARLTDLIISLKEKTIILWYSILLQHRILVLGQNPQLVAGAVFSAPLLIRPLNGIHSWLTPHLPSGDFSSLQERSCICGTSNMEMSGSKELFDTVVNLSKGSVKSKTNIKISKADMKLMKAVLHGINQKQNENWVQEQFFSYTYQFLQSLGLGLLSDQQKDLLGKFHLTRMYAQYAKSAPNAPSAPPDSDGRTRSIGGKSPR